MSGEFSWGVAFVGVAIVSGLISVSQFSGYITGSYGTVAIVFVVLCVIVAGVTGGLWRHLGLFKQFERPLYPRKRTLT